MRFTSSLARPHARMLSAMFAAALFSGGAGGAAIAELHDVRVAALAAKPVAPPLSAPAATPMASPPSRPMASAAPAAPVAAPDASSGAVHSVAGLTGPGAEAFDWAFRFASAVKSDPRDMARAQESVVDDLSEAGKLDEALERAGLIRGWRQGAALADIAARMAESGRTTEARALLDRVETIRTSTDGWEGPRVEAHIAQALASMGEAERAGEIGGKLAADDRQYEGRSAATVATGLARQGNFKGAMDALAPLNGSDEVDVAWWRTAGYLAVARQERLPAEQRRRALDAARSSAEKVPDWRRAESLQSVAEEYRRIGALGEARACLESAEKQLSALPTTMAVRSPLLSNLARSWARAGEKSRARAILGRAGGHVDDAMLTERPAIWGNLASSYAAVGDEKDAWKTFDRALQAAAGLENARPRALSIVSICRAIAKSGLLLPESTRARLQSLYAGLKDPW